MKTTLKVKRLHPEAVLPTYTRQDDAGLDLVALSVTYDTATGTYIYSTGVSVVIPEGHVGLLCARSSIFKTNLSLANGVGVIDHGFLGEVKVLMKARSEDLSAPYRPGDRVAQLIVIPIPKVQVEEVSDVGTSVRGTQGFGSSGR